MCTTGRKLTGCCELLRAAGQDAKGCCSRALFFTCQPPPPLQGLGLRGMTIGQLLEATEKGEQPVEAGGGPFWASNPPAEPSLRPPQKARQELARLLSELRQRERLLGVDEFMDAPTAELKPDALADLLACLHAHRPLLWAFMKKVRPAALPHLHCTPRLVHIRHPSHCLPLPLPKPD